MLCFYTQRMQGWLRASPGKAPKALCASGYVGFAEQQPPGTASRHSLLFVDAWREPWGEVLPQKGSQRNRSASWPSWLESPFPPALIQTTTCQNSVSEPCSLHLQEEKVLGRLFSTSSSQGAGPTPSTPASELCRTCPRSSWRSLKLLSVAPAFQG